jgi:hypothetical protein
MAYIPKHKINKLIASEGEFIFRKSKKPHIGPYIETARGEYYAGEDPYKLQTINLLEKVIPDPTDFIFNDVGNVKIFNIINKRLKNKLKKLKPLSSSKPTPTEKDYEKFKFTRYFAKRINSQYGYFEISKKAYNSLKSKKPEYDFNLYTIGEIEWALVGNTQVININTLRIAELDNPGLSLCFKKLNEYRDNKNRNLFNSIKEYDPYKQEGLTSSQIKEAIALTDSQKDNKNPKKLIDPNNFKLYNIEGRQYIDGAPIPNNLPKAYGHPKPIGEVLIKNQNCLSCYFNEGGLCNYWKANIRNNYWCAAWVNYQEEELTYQEFQDQVTETITTETSTVSSIGDVTLDDKEEDTFLDFMRGGGGTSGGGGGGY